MHQSLPPLPNQNYIRSPGNESDDAEQAIHSNYLRLQSTLLGAVDKQVLDIEGQLREKAMNLKKTEQDKLNFGVALYESRMEISRMNNKYYSVKKNAEKIESDKKNDETYRINLEKELADALILNKALQGELEKKKAMLTDSELKVSQISAVNLSYNSDIKVQHRIQNKLKKEYELTESQKKQIKSDLIDQKKKTEEIQIENVKLIRLLEAQASETATAQKSIDKMNQEITGLLAEKKALEKNWGDAMTAMTKRDDAFQGLSDKKDEIKSKLTDNEISMKSVKWERRELEKTLKKTEEDFNSTNIRFNLAQENSNSLEMQNRELTAKLNETRLSESNFRSMYEQTNKKYLIMAADYNYKSQNIIDLEKELNALKQNFKDSVESESFLKAAKYQEKAEYEKENEIKTIISDEENKSIIFRRENALLQLELEQQKTITEIAIKDKEKLEKDYKKIDSSHMDIGHKYNRMVYSLKRSEYDAQTLKNFINSKVDESIAPKLVAQSLTTEVNDLKNESYKFQNLWIDSQKEILKLKEALAKNQKEQTYLGTKLGISTTINEKASDEIEFAKGLAKDFQQDSSKLYNQMTKLQSQISDLKKRNSLLELKLEESRLQLEEGDVKQEKSTHMLKTEIRRVYKERKFLEKDIIEDKKFSQTMEVKHRLASEMVERLKTQRNVLQKENYQLKEKTKDLEKKNNESILLMKRYAESGGAITSSLVATSNSHKSRNNNNQNNDTPLWAVFDASSGGGSLGHKKENFPSFKSDATIEKTKSNVSEIRELPDFESWRLKIESLSSENEFLRNENKKIRSQLDETLRKCNQFERQVTEISRNLKSLEEQEQKMRLGFDDATRRCARAEFVAAHLETQFKDFKPNIKIDYQMLSQAEASIQLVAALLPRDSPDFRIEDEGKQIQAKTH